MGKSAFTERTYIGYVQAKHKDIETANLSSILHFPKKEIDMETKTFHLIRIVLLIIIIAGLGTLNAVAEHNAMPKAMYDKSQAQIPSIPDASSAVEIIGHIGGSTEAIAI